jgi:hypothetical protein
MWAWRKNRKEKHDADYEFLLNEIIRLEQKIDSLQFMTVGEELPEVIKCAHCGQRQRSDRILCITCGNVLTIKKVP